MEYGKKNVYTAYVIGKEKWDGQYLKKFWLRISQN